MIGCLSTAGGKLSDYRTYRLCAPGNGEVVAMASDVEPIASVRVVDAVFCGLLESETEIVTVYVPELEVPLIKPLEALYVKLRGNPVMVHTKGKVPPDVSGWKLYGVPDVPCGREVVVMVRLAAGPTVKGQVAAAATPVDVLHLDGERAGGAGRPGNGAGQGVQRQAGRQRPACQREGVRGGAAADGQGRAVHSHANLEGIRGRARERRRPGDGDGAADGSDNPDGVLHLNGEAAAKPWVCR